MGNGYRISVLIGIYNCASTLEDAISSLYAQSYQNFKIIMCDDGSTDDTLKIAQTLADCHDNILLLKNEVNMGLNYTLNKCLDYADTEYIARMDGDDISLPSRFEKEIDFLDRNKEYAVVSTTMIHFDEKGDFLIGDAVKCPTPKDFIHGTPVCHAPCMARTSIVKALGGYTVDRRLLRVEDYHLWMKLYAAGYKAYNIQEPLYKMRDDRNAKSRRTWQNRKNEIYVRFIGFRMLGLPWYYQIYSLRPLLAYMAPSVIYDFFHRK